jgi:hypothetical protein
VCAKATRRRYPLQGEHCNVRYPCSKLSSGVPGIRRTRMFLGPPDLHPDPLVTTSTDPDPSLFS